MREHLSELCDFSERWLTYQIRGAAGAIRYLAEQDVKVINISGFLSRGHCPDTVAWKALEDAFAYAAERDVVIVLGAGNNATRTEDYPGTEATVLIVGACLLDGTRWEEKTVARGGTFHSGSNYGSRLSVMAPVENLVVCRPHDKAIYNRTETPLGPTRVKYVGPHEVVPKGATSSAAPIVTSLVALIRAVRPDLDAESVVHLVKEGCEDIGKPGYDLETGHGRVAGRRCGARGHCADSGPARA